MPGELKDRIAEVAKDLPRGWQARLAEHCEVRAPSVAGWVSGKTKELEGLNLIRAAAFFGVNPEWLATGRGQPRPRGEGNVVATEPPPAYTAKKPPASGGKEPDYRTIVLSLARSLELEGRNISAREFVELAEDYYRKLSR